MFRKDGKAVAGLGKLSEEGARPAWMICCAVTDADATTRAVEGGTVRVPPRDLGERGRTAQHTDPADGRFAAWQPGRQAGFELADEPGSLSWTELCTSDAAAARQLCGTVLGWRFSDAEMPGGGGTYTLITGPGRL